MKSIIGSASVFAALAAAQTTTLTPVFTFAPTAESATRPECVPTQCVSLPATITAADIEKCVGAAAPGCQYTGSVSANGQTAEVCYADATTATYLDVALPIADLVAAGNVEFGAPTGSVSFTADVASTVECPFYAYLDAGDVCVNTGTPSLGNSPIATMALAATDVTVNLADLGVSALTNTNLGLATANPIASCGTTFASATLSNFNVSYTATVPETSELPPATETPDVELFTQFNQAANSALECYSPECTFKLMPVTREQVEACVASVPETCVFNGVSSLVTSGTQHMCVGTAATDKQYVVVDLAALRGLGRGSAPMTGTITVDMLNAAALDCPVSGFKVTAFDPSNNCGIVEPITPSAAAVSSLPIDTATFSVDAAQAYMDASLGLVITGPPASCGTAANAVQTTVSAPFVYSRQIDGSANPEGVASALALGTLALVTLALAA